jgi:hypothetical protein
LRKQRVESMEDSVSKSHATGPEPARQLQAQTGDPLFVLASPRSFSSVAAGMLGQHPQMYGVPELQLLGVETMAEWWQLCAKATFPMTHGLLRAVAELYFGEQTDETILRARTWLRRRSHFTTGGIIKALSRRVQPLILVEKSPSICYRKNSLQRALRVFPRARFIHLVRHPWGHSRSVLKAVHDTEQDGPVPYWIMRLAAFPERPEQKKLSASVHPQRSWQVLNRNIVSFLEQMPATQWIRVRGEDLLAKPEQELPRLAHWLGIRADSAAIEEMKHPERSAFACLGPSNARLGNDIHFLTGPTLRADRADVRGLDEPFTWRDQKFYFCDDVKRLARSFGYS